MNTGKIMEVVKKNVMSIACGVVAVAAIVAAFWPVGGFFTTLKDNATQRASAYGALSGLISKTRQLPLTDPSKTTQDPLTVFPTQPIIDAGDAATKNVHDQSVNMVKTVVTLNQANHPLLIPDVFSNLASDTPKLRFRDVYKAVLDKDAAVSEKTDENLKNAKQKNLWNDVLIGGVPPTQQDFDAKRTSMWDNEYSIRIQYVNGQPWNKAQIDAQFAKASAMVPDQMKTAVAKQKKVYVSPDAFVINQNVTGLQTPSLFDIWNAQLVLWIQSDIASAIAQANANSPDVISAPIKRLYKLEIPSNPTPYLLATPVAAAAVGMPPTLTPFENGDIVQIPKLYNLSLTGRAGNAMYDVVQFKLSLDVDASQIPLVLATLSQNRLIDVYNMEMLSLDASDTLALGYIYGPLPVVRLNLRCEALFLREWTVPLMPKQIREGVLGIAAPLPPTPAAAAPTAQ